MDGFLHALAENIGFVALAVAVVLVLFAMAFSHAVEVRSRARTRRDLAAFVAEGSMTADEAERILNAGGRAGGCCGTKRGPGRAQPNNEERS